MKLSDFREFTDYLKGYSGVYELGFVRGNLFTPMYVGKATCLYNRISSYTRPSCHNEFVRMKAQSNYNNVWFHVFKTDYFAESEARLQHRFEIGRNGGEYSWNWKKERLPR